MDQKRKLFLLDKINTEIDKKIRAVEAAHEISKDYQLAALGSGSIGGDRLHAENHEQLQRSQLSLLKNVKDQVEQDRVKFITVEYENGRKSDFYFMNSNVLLPDILIVTPDSPLGNTIQGKKVDDSFSFLAREKKITGKITAID